MKKRRNFIVSGILLVLAGLCTNYAWNTSNNSLSVNIMIFATALFMAAVVIFVMNFRE
ncbi:hypothetical protein D3C87_1561570 [compost metagenome]|jgi:hypothetical protein|uniref:hypothetical protein n=1 Tax=Pedobacter sp. TaxID=1411316 RepID=UPI000F941F25